MNFRIGTRGSKLALWQAHNISQLLLDHGYASEIVVVRSEGEVDLKTPLYSMGIEGIFTRSLDQALINKKIDIAVHSLKDLPTTLAQGTILVSTPKRGNPYDSLLFKAEGFWDTIEEKKIIATSSLRRRAQWLNRYSNHNTRPIRGNIQTRINETTKNKELDALIIAQAALERMDIKPQRATLLNWMLPAPSQGALGVCCLEENKHIHAILEILQHEPTAICTTLERQVLKRLDGGCTLPIGTHATIVNNQIFIKANVLSLNGKEKVEVKVIFPQNKWASQGEVVANKILEQGGGEIIKSIRDNL